MRIQYHQRRQETTVLGYSRQIPGRLTLDSSTSTSLNTTMASMSEEEERIETVSKFLLQSPPGEINDVLNGAVVSLFHVSWPDTPASA